MSQNRIYGPKVTLTSDNFVLEAPLGNKGLTFVSEKESGATPRSLAIGYLSGAGLTTGSSDTFYGFNAGQFATTANNCTCIGAQAGNNITTQNNATYVGAQAGTNGGMVDGTAVGYANFFKCTGARNTGVGSTVGGAATTAANNTIVGAYAAPVLTTGTGNCIFGDGLAASLTTGSSNVLSGTAAGAVLSTGSHNLILGNTFATNQAGQTLTTGSNNIILQGDVPTSSTSNAIVIGKGGSHSSCTIAGITGVNQTGPNVAVTVNGSGVLGVGAVSLREFKENITAINEEENHFKLMQVLPRNYTFKAWEEKILQHGVIIDEVKEVFPELIGQCNGQDFYVNYEQFIALLIADLQYAWKSMHNLEARLAVLENK